MHTLKIYCYTWELYSDLSDLSVLEDDKHKAVSNLAWWKDSLLIAAGLELDEL